jgi:hypothetical protein
MPFRSFVLNVLVCPGLLVLVRLLPHEFVPARPLSPKILRLRISIFFLFAIAMLFRSRCLLMLSRPLFRLISFIFMHTSMQCIQLFVLLSVALSPRANYTDRVTATCRRNLVPTFVNRRVSRGQRGGSPTVVNLSFLVAPHLLSQVLSGPRSRPTATQKIW